MNRWSFLSTAAVQAELIRAGPGTVHGLQFFNAGASAVHVRLYDKATAPGTGDTPIWRGTVPPSNSGFAVTLGGKDGLAVALGLGIRVTGAVADNDATVLNANEVKGNVQFR